MPITNGVLTITPDDIKITGHLFDAFDNYETEVSAQWLVEFAQTRGEGWTSFTYEQIESFYGKSSYRNFGFNSLVDRGFIRRDANDDRESRSGTYHYTEEFIARCYQATR
jgi:hypothetical protein